VYLFVSECRLQVHFLRPNMLEGLLLGSTFSS